VRDIVCPNHVLSALRIVTFLLCDAVSHDQFVLVRVPRTGEPERVIDRFERHDRLECLDYRDRALET
jgi:hypothetical protein